MAKNDANHRPNSCDSPAKNDANMQLLVIASIWLHLIVKQAGKIQLVRSRVAATGAVIGLLIALAGLLWNSANVLFGLNIAGLAIGFLFVIRPIVIFKTKKSLANFTNLEIVESMLCIVLAPTVFYFVFSLSAID